MTALHLYLVERTDPADLLPGELAGYVVCAEHERYALEQAPSGGFGQSVTTVTHIGLPLNGASPGVIWPRAGVAAHAVFLVGRRHAGPGGCRGYVAVAEDRDRALWYCPAGGLDVPAGDVEIRHIGIAINGTEAGVILASFNAG